MSKYNNILWKFNVKPNKLFANIYIFKFQISKLACDFYVIGYLC